MLNQVNLQGRLVADPKVGRIKHTADGDVKKYLFTVASQDEFGKQATQFIRCAAWGRTGDFINKWFKKGNMIFLTGRLTSFKDYEEHDGETIMEVSIEKASFPPREDKAETPTDDTPIEIVDEDLPF